MRRKWNCLDKRVTQARERKNPIIAVVRSTASRLRFHESGMKIIIRISSSTPDEFSPAEHCFRALEGGEFKIKMDRMGTVHSPVSRCPKSVRPYLMIDNEETTEADISEAHVVMLIKLYEKHFLKDLGMSLDPVKVKEERTCFKAMVESGAVYGAEGSYREKNKVALLTSLNIDVKNQMGMDVTKRLLTHHPLLRDIFWRLKNKDHRVLSRWLQRWTSDIVNPSVLLLHKNGIPSIPIVDCLLVRKRDKEAAVEELSKRIFESTGVCAKVGGIRYSPTVEKKPMLTAIKSGTRSAGIRWIEVPPRRRSNRTVDHRQLMLKID